MNATTLDALLLHGARAQAALRWAYRRAKPDPAARYFTYVLLLQRGKVYVGNTDNVYTRLVDHVRMSPGSSLWVREHGPVQRVMEVARACARDDETYKTLEYMELMGWENVRGAAYCRPGMRAPPAALATFRRDPTRPFTYLTREEIDGVLREVAALAAAEDAG